MVEWSTRFHFEGRVYNRNVGIGMMSSSLLLRKPRQEKRRREMREAEQRSYIKPALVIRR